ncbi:MAG: enoyl-CoA hydratase-related protein [Syntrophothermaceae bacterium]|jgi:enoyl-CoA hydratase
MAFVTLEVQGNVGIVTVNRPPVNAINAEVYQEMADTFRSINGMDEVRVVILRAEGKHFMAGNDLSELNDLNQSSILAYRDVVKCSVGAVYDCRVPVVAAVNGAALGAGLAYAASCDIIVASEDAFFGIPEVKIGFISAAGFASLLVPGKMVNYMALTGSALKAQEMLDKGAVHKVVPREKLMEAAMEVAEELLANSPLIQQYFKKALHINSNARLGDQYDVEFGFSAQVLDSEDYKEAKEAFLEHRVPVYKGR